MRIRRGGNGNLHPMEIGIKNQIFLEKPEVGILIPIKWFYSCSRCSQRSHVDGLCPAGWPNKQSITKHWFQSVRTCPYSWATGRNTMTAFLPVWNSHCTSVSFTVIVSCSDELAIHSCFFLCLQRRVAKVTSRLFYCWSLLRNNTMATNLQRFTLYYSTRRFVAWDCWTHTSWQVIQRDSDMLTAVSRIRLYFVKRSTSEPIAMLQQV